ncbi:unnamed protein product, partial [Effrenium voratum]
HHSAVLERGSWCHAVVPSLPQGHGLPGLRMAHQLHRASTACRSAGPDRGGVRTHATELLRAALPH